MIGRSAAIVPVAAPHSTKPTAAIFLIIVETQSSYAAAGYSLSITLITTLLPSLMAALPSFSAAFS